MSNQELPSAVATPDFALAPPKGVEFKRDSAGVWMLQASTPLAFRVLVPLLSAGILTYDTYWRIPGFELDGPGFIGSDLPSWFKGLVVLSAFYQTLLVWLPRQLRVTASHLEVAGLLRNKRIPFDETACTVITERLVSRWKPALFGRGFYTTYRTYPHLDITLDDQTVIPGVAVGDREFVEFVAAFVDAAKSADRSANQTREPH